MADSGNNRRKKGPDTLFFGLSVQPNVPWRPQGGGGGGGGAVTSMKDIRSFKKLSQVF